MTFYRHLICPCVLSCNVEKLCDRLYSVGCQAGRFCLPVGLLLMLGFSTFAQEGGMSNWESSAPSLERAPVHGISASGFCRVLGYVRSQQEVFPNNSGKTMAVLVGDLYREPMFLTRLKLVTQDGVQFGVDLMGNSLFKGPEVEPSALTLDLGLNTSLKIKKPWGKVTLQTGGVTWYRQSRLTVWGNQAFNRLSLFDRRPQAAVDATPWTRYRNYVDEGLVDMGLRYGSRAFQGMFFGLSDLPGGMKLKGVVGKSNFNRPAFEGAMSFTSSWRVAKDVGEKGNLAINTLMSRSALDSTFANERAYHLHTMESRFGVRNHVVIVEGGWGFYAENSSDAVQQGGALFLDVRASPDARIPLSLRAYRIAPEFVNVTGNFLNSSVLEVFPNVAGIGATVRAPFESPLVGLGIPVNNRQGLELQAQGQILGCAVNVGMGVSSEISPTQGGVSYFHLVNGETISRLNLFSRAWGPYNALNSVYRRTFEVAALSDSLVNAGASFQKRFNTLEAQLKKRGQCLDHAWTLLSTLKLRSAQREWFGLHQSAGTALLKQQCMQLDLGVELNPRVVALGHLGVERVVGNDETSQGDADVPSVANRFQDWLSRGQRQVSTMARNQTHQRVGVGLDVSLFTGVNLYVRQQWYSYQDPNFTMNQLSGTETMVELKMTF